MEKRKTKEAKWDGKNEKNEPRKKGGDAKKGWGGKKGENRKKEGVVRL